MKKQYLLGPALLLATSLSMSVNAAGVNVTDKSASIAIGANANKSGVGYAADVRWQFSPYAILNLGVKSKLSPESYSVKSLLTEEEYNRLVDAGYEYPLTVTPRFTMLSAGLYLQYPLQLTNFSVAPTVGLHATQSRVESIDLFKKGTGSSGTGSSGNTGTTSGDKVGAVKFPSVQSIRLRAGLRVETGDHGWSLGYQKHSMSEQWLTASFSRDPAGFYFDYAYSLTDHASIIFQLESEDVFGEESFVLGGKWVF